MIPLAAAAYAHRVVFLSDGKVVDDVFGRTSEPMLDGMKLLED